MAEPERSAGDDPAPSRLHVAWRRWLTAHARLVARIDADLASAGRVSMEWYDVLLALYEADGRRLRLGELAERVLFSRSGLTRLVDRVVAAGFVMREPCPDDRRGAFAVLTAAGVKELDLAWAVYRTAIDAHFGSKLTAAQIDAVASACGAVLRGLGDDGSTTAPATLSVRGKPQARAKGE